MFCVGFEDECSKWDLPWEVLRGVICIYKINLAQKYDNFMKIAIISNTLFGHKNHKEFIDYFKDSFIPYLKENKVDKVVHLGGLFNSKNINISILNDVYILFKEISQYSNIEILVSEKDKISKNHNNSYIFLKSIQNVDIIEDNKETQYYNLLSSNSFIQNNKINLYTEKENIHNGYNGYYTHFSKNRIGSPYQIDEKDKGKKKGFFMIDFIKKEKKFIENDYNKKFIKKIIKTEEDLNSLNKKLFENNVHIEINKELYKNNENKINVILSQYDIKKISYSEDKKEEDIEEDISLDIETNIRKEIEQMQDSELLLMAFDDVLKKYKN
jgi:hypothetical protein